MTLELRGLEQDAPGRRIVRGRHPVLQDGAAPRAGFRRPGDQPGTRPPLSPGIGQFLECLLDLARLGDGWLSHRSGFASERSLVDGLGLLADPACLCQTILEPI
jgi:hypothetical protein